MSRPRRPRSVKPWPMYQATSGILAPCPLVLVDRRSVGAVLSSNRQRHRAGVGSPRRAVGLAMWRPKNGKGLRRVLRDCAVNPDLTIRIGRISGSGYYAALV